MEKISKTNCGTDPRLQAEYGRAKSFLHEKKALQKRLREIDKHLRELRAVAVAASDCALHDLAYEANISVLPSTVGFPSLHKPASPVGLNCTT